MAETEHLAIETAGWVRWLRSGGYGISDVRIRFEPDERGRLVAREIRIADEDGLRAEQLREVPLARLERWVNGAEVTAAIRGEQAGKVPRQRIGAKVVVPTRRGRAPYPDPFYRRVGDVVVAGHSARAIAEASKVPVSTVNRWIKGARERGFLEPSRRGEGEKS
jgi:hypothetical protein